MADLDRLWAPWRQAFLARPRKRGCFFCAAKRARADRRHHVIDRGRVVFALLNRYPYNNGHLLIAPYRHIGDLERLRAEEWAETFEMSRRLIRRLRRALNPQGFNLGFNIGRSAGAGIPGHLHLHIVPRWEGDTNSMTTLAGLKVISQALDELYPLLSSKVAE